MYYTSNFQAYKDDVVAAFISKQTHEPDQDWLIRPTRARLKQRCLQLASAELKPGDESILREFFEIEGRGVRYRDAIDVWNAEDFKTLEIFLKKPETQPAEKNVQLLAWLIQFEPRPFAEYQKGLTDRPVNEERNREKTDHAETPNEVEDSKKERDNKVWPVRESAKSRWKQIAAGGGVLLTILAAWYIYRSDDNKCMYWNGEHYVATACTVPRLDTPIVPLDPARLRGFRQLRHLDTLTSYAVDRFWYAQKGKHVDVFTGPGVHPVYPDRRLKLVKDYVVNFCHSHNCDIYY